MIKKLFLILLVSALGYSQEKESNQDHRLDFAFSPGIIQQSNTFLEANLFVGMILTDTGGDLGVPAVGDVGFRFGIESDCNKTFAPKIGCEIAATMVTLRLSGVQYFQDGNSEFRLLPEFGFCIGGLVKQPASCYKILNTNFHAG